MKAHLLTIGDELLIGQTVNTNAAWLGEQLSLLGAEVVGSSVVGDETETIRDELRRAFERADLVVTTGGLGPTHDDVTKKVVADFFGVSLREDAEIARRIESYYAETDRSVPAAVRALAEVPEGFDILENPAGTAPGLWRAEAPANGTAPRVLIVLPGVPQEMQQIMEAAGLPRLQERADLQTVAHRTLLTTGIVESSLQEKIGGVVQAMDGGALKLAYLPSTSGVRLRLTARADTREAAEAQLDHLDAALRARVEKYIFGMGKDTLEAAVGRMLTERGLTVAAAESATAGYLMHRLTKVSGASAYFLGGVVAYGNAVKESALDVEALVFENEGAVSEEAARQMAKGARERLGADLGVSTTGVAGPTGGTARKPVGTVWIGFADAAGTHARRFRFTKDRQINIELFSTAALEMLRRQLLRRDAR